MYTADLQLTYQPSAPQQLAEPTNDPPASLVDTASASDAGTAI